MKDRKQILKEIEEASERIRTLEQRIRSLYRELDSIDRTIGLDLLEDPIIYKGKSDYVFSFNKT